MEPRREARTRAKVKVPIAIDTILRTIDKERQIGPPH